MPHFKFSSFESQIQQFKRGFLSLRGRGSQLAIQKFLDYLSYSMHFKKGLYTQHGGCSSVKFPRLSLNFSVGGDLSFSVW